VTHAGAPPAAAGQDALLLSVLATGGSIAREVAGVEQRMGPADLPHSRIEAITTGRCVGRYSASPWVGEDHRGDIYTGAGRFIRGRFREVDQDAGTCAFHPDDPAALSGLQSGVSYPYRDFHWGERAEADLTSAQTDDGNSTRNPAGHASGVAGPAPIPTPPRPAHCTAPSGKSACHARRRHTEDVPAVNDPG
jgi:hypothetical protein